MRVPLLFVLLPLAGLCGSPAARAAASLMVDDASITPAGRCQLESWVRLHHRNGQERVAVAACTWAGTEWSLGLGNHSGESTRDAALGIKRPLPLAGTSPLQLAVALAFDHDLHHTRSRGLSLGLPMSIALGPASTVHVEAGLRRQHDARGWTFGTGLERLLSPRWSVLGELARDVHRDTHVQFGLRRQLPSGSTLDLLHGRALGDARTHWVTLGLNLALPH